MTPGSSRFQMVWILLYSGPNLSVLLMAGYRPFLDDQPPAGEAGGEPGGVRFGGEDGGDVAGARTGGAGGGVTHQPHHARRHVRCGGFQQTLRRRLVTGHVRVVRRYPPVVHPGQQIPGGGDGFCRQLRAIHDGGHSSCPDSISPAGPTLSSKQSSSTVTAWAIASLVPT